MAGTLFFPSEGSKVSKKTWLRPGVGGAEGNDCSTSESQGSTEFSTAPTSPFTIWVCVFEGTLRVA